MYFNVCVDIVFCVAHQQNCLTPVFVFGVSFCIIRNGQSVILQKNVFVLHYVATIMSATGDVCLQRVDFR